MPIRNISLTPPHTSPAAPTSLMLLEHTFLCCPYLPLLHMFTFKWYEDLLHDFTVVQDDTPAALPSTPNQPDGGRGCGCS